MKPRRQGRGPAVLVLFIVLTATLFGFWREAELARRELALRWQDSFTQLQPILGLLLSQRFEALRDQAKATLRRENFSATGWNDFLAASEWRQHFPGMLEIGYAGFTNDQCVVKFLASRQTSPAYLPGFDLDGDPALHEAVQVAAAGRGGVAPPEFSLGAPAGAVRVVIDFLPLTITDRPPGTALENRANLHGFIFFALNQPLYFAAARSSLAALPVDLRLLPAEAPAPPRTPSLRAFSKSFVSGEWRFVATLKTPTGARLAPQWIVLFGGTALSLLLYGLFAMQARLRLTAEAANADLLQRDAEILTLNHGLEHKIALRTAELSEANERLVRFQAVIESTSDLVGMAGLDGRTIYLNQAGRRMLEFPANVDVQSLTMSQFYPADVNRFFMEVALPQAMRDGFWAGETRLLTNNQREIPVSFVGTVVKSVAGQPLHLACIARDISSRQAIEHELHRALAEEKELNRLKSNFISMVTHEIRTPLAVILGSSEILSRYMDRLTPEKRAGHLLTIDAAVLRMSALMEDVLLFSKAEAGRMDFNPAPMDLGGFCTQMLDELASATNRRCPFTLTVSNVVEPARADENLLRHIFSNLLANAAKYSPPGSPVFFSVVRAGGDAVFTVQDRGLGIPEEDRKRLFTPFFRGTNVTTIQGTGLGLVIVQHCLTRHGGDLEITSTENAGTTVRVRLPLYSPAHTEFIQRFSPRQPNA